MPWCVTCARYLAPPTVRPDGSCPTCGRSVAVETGTGATGTADSLHVGGLPGAPDQLLPPVPWHLKLLGVAVAAYLALRAWQGIAWIAEKL